ncbi:MAG: alkaline phosphatase [Fimbriimonadaceae bacterium]|nr:alkaline phosphatase [Fimbriimonadaceae bacterium]
MKLSRRSLLGAGSLGLAGLAAGMAGAESLQYKPRRARRAKNVIFCVVDGMAHQTFSMVDAHSRYVNGKPSYWGWLVDQEFAVNGLQETRSLSSVVTDSAAASSTWGSGRRVWNGMINTFPDGTPDGVELRTLYGLLHEKGVRTGLVTTTTITHATPSGFAINCVNRDLEALIAERYLKSGVDVLMGGGNRFFAADKRKDKMDLYAKFREAGYDVVQDRTGMLASRARKVLGIFADGHLPYTVDRNHSPEIAAKVPTLAEMTAHAINELKTNRNGFFLQIEGGRVDHAAHSSDLAGLFYDQIAFEDALKVAIDFAMADGDTLVIITADHACGGPSLNGDGEEYIDTNTALASFSGFKASFETILKTLGASPSVGDVQGLVQAKLGYKLTPTEASAVVDATKGNSPFKASNFYRSVNMTMATVLGNHNRVNFTSGNHTAEHVLVTAVGPGAEQVGGITPNTRFFDIMLAAKGLKHENPTMDFATAARNMDKMKAAIDPDFIDMYSAHEECGCDEAYGYR